MPPVGFESTISAGERPQTYALDSAATGTGLRVSLQSKNIRSLARQLHSCSNRNIFFTSCHYMCVFFSSEQVTRKQKKLLLTSTIKKKKAHNLHCIPAHFTPAQDQLHQQNTLSYDVIHSATCFQF